MKKNIVIIGPPRCGKSTLAQKLVKELNGYSMISGDNFTTSYIEVCKRSGIKTIDLNIPRTQCYYYFADSMRYENSINYVFETSRYNEEIIKKNKHKLIIIFLGYSKLSEKELFDNIRKNDTENDWTFIESDWKLKLYCEAFVEENKEKEQIAKNNNYWYVDTSYDRSSVLDDTVAKIKKIINQ